MPGREPDTWESLLADLDEAAEWNGPEPTEQGMPDGETWAWRQAAAMAEGWAKRIRVLREKEEVEDGK